METVEISGMPHDDEAYPRVVMLFTSMTSDRLIRVNQERLLQLYSVRGVPVTTVDASEPEHKALREALFAVSGLKAVYPQTYLQASPGGSYHFVGDFKTLHTMNEHNEHTGAFDRAFVDVPAYSDCLGAERKAWLVKRGAQLAQNALQWEKCTTKGGEDYWFSKRTGESSWVNPSEGTGEDGVWIPQTDSKGRGFFYNRRTGKSAWTLPKAN
jgi:hypothetical protein